MHKTVISQTYTPTCSASTWRPGQCGNAAIFHLQGCSFPFQFPRFLEEHRLLITVDHWLRDIVCLLALFVVAGCRALEHLIAILLQFLYVAPLPSITGKIPERIICSTLVFFRRQTCSLHSVMEHLFNCVLSVAWAIFIILAVTARGKTQHFLNWVHRNVR